MLIPGIPLPEKSQKECGLKLKQQLETLGIKAPGKFIVKLLLHSLFAK